MTAVRSRTSCDHYLRNSNDRLYFNFYKVDLDTEQIGRRTGFYGVDNNNTSAYQASWLHIFSPGLLNEFSYGQIRVQGSAGDSPGIPFRVPDINITYQNTGINAGWGPATFIQHNYNWRDVVTWVRGAHSLKIGGEAWMGDDDAQFRAPYERPSFQFNNLLDLVRDQPYQESGVNYDPITSGKRTACGRTRPDWSHRRSGWARPSNRSCQSARAIGRRSGSTTR